MLNVLSKLANENEFRTMKMNHPNGDVLRNNESEMHSYENVFRNNEIDLHSYENVLS